MLGPSVGNRILKLPVRVVFWWDSQGQRNTQLLVSRLA